MEIQPLWWNIVKFVVHCSVVFGNFYFLWPSFPRNEWYKSALLFRKEYYVGTRLANSAFGHSGTSSPPFLFPPFSFSVSSPSGVWGEASADKWFGASSEPKGAAMVATVFVHFYKNKFKFLYKHKTEVKSCVTDKHNTKYNTLISEQPYIHARWSIFTFPGQNEPPPDTMGQFRDDPGHSRTVGKPSGYSAMKL